VAQDKSHVVHVLEADDRWLLTPPAPIQMDTSSILRLPDGTWLTVNDKGLPPYEIRFGSQSEAFLVPRPDLFPPEAIADLNVAKEHRWDAEGLAVDHQGRLYLCDEPDRWIVRQDLSTGVVEHLDIDWSPVRHLFHPTDLNASFEGIAVGGDVLYVANERSEGRILAVNLSTLQVIDHFQVRPKGRPRGDVHYSALCWYDDRLWVLCRRDQCILEVDPETHFVLAEYDYSNIENAKENAYLTGIHFGMAEGLFVDNTHFWVVIDNNGLRRRAALSDRRPLLFRALRPNHD
jgi:hypothetical protein